MSDFLPNLQVEHLYDYRPSTQLNVLVFGLSGSGKSSLINNIFSDSEYVRQPATPRTSEFGQKTVNYQSYHLSQNISFFDPWGWNGNDDGDYPFRLMLDARIRNHHFFKEDIVPTDQNYKRLIDVVLFVVDASQKDKPKTLKGMKKYYKIAKEKEIETFVVVTKLDLVLGDKKILTKKDWKHSVQLICRGKEFLEIERLIHSEVSPRATVVPVINYSSEDTFPNPLIFELCKKFVNLIIQKIHLIRKLAPTIPYDMFKGETSVKVEYGHLIELSSSCETPTEQKEVFFDQKKTSKRIEFKPPKMSQTNHILNGFICHKHYQKIEIGEKIYRLFGCTTLYRCEEVIVGVWCPEDYKYFECVRPKEEDTIAKLKASLLMKNEPRFEFINEVRKGGLEGCPGYIEGLTKYLVLSDSIERDHFIFEERNLQHLALFVESHIQAEKREDRISQNNERSMAEWLRSSREDLRKELVSKIQQSHNSTSKNLQTLKIELTALVGRKIEEMRLRIEGNKELLFQHIKETPTFNFDLWKQDVVSEIENIFISRKENIENTTALKEAVRLDFLEEHNRLKDIIKNQDLKISLMDKHILESKKKNDDEILALRNNLKELQGVVLEIQKSQIPTSPRIHLSQIIHDDDDDDDDDGKSINEENNNNNINDSYDRRIKLNDDINIHPPRMINPSNNIESIDLSPNDPSFGCFYCRTCNLEIQNIRYECTTRDRNFSFCHECFLNRREVGMQDDGFIVIDQKKGLIKVIGNSFYEKYQNKINNLAQMGFQGDQIVILLVKHDGDVSEVVRILTGGE